MEAIANLEEVSQVKIFIKRILITNTNFYNIFIIIINKNYFLPKLLCKNIIIIT